jgi:hypothetical protein
LQVLMELKARSGELKAPLSAGQLELKPGEPLQKQLLAMKMP